LALGAVLLGYNQCVTPMTSGKSNSLKFTDQKSSSSTVGTVSRAVSLEAFRTTVYSVTRARCITCHGASQTPMHAASDVNVAYDAVINSSKVDFANPANSRLVLKLRNENHNCWGNCASNADEMLSQINSWKSLTSGTTADVNNTNIGGKTTRETMTVQNALNPNINSNSSNVTLMAEASSLKAPMAIATDAGTSYVWTPATAGIKDLTSQDAGTATLNFSVQASDFYNIYMYVNAPSTTSDSVYVKISGSDYKEWTLDATTGFQWMELTNTPQKLQTEFYLTGSKNYQLEIRQKEPGVKISKVVVTNDLSYDPNGMAKVNQKATLSASLADITGVSDAYIDIDIEEFDLYSYKLTNPRIRSSKDLKVKKLKILVNGSFNPQHATYLVVDKIATKTDPSLSSASMVLLKDKGAEFDKLSFSFDIIEVAK
jgi:hypothetical protein